MKGNNFSSSSTILDEIDGKFRPPPRPKARMGKWRGEWGFAVPVYSVLLLAVVVSETKAINSCVPQRLFCTDVDNTLNRWG